MPNVTLVMTRQPLAEFLWERGRNPHYEDIDDEEERTFRFGEKDDKGKRRDVAGRSRGLMSGQWGTMVVVEGPLVYTAGRLPVTSVGAMVGAAVALMVTPGPQGTPPPVLQSITLGGRTVFLQTDGGKITRTTEFDTMERYRTDSNKSSWYVRLPAQPNKPFPVVGFISSTVASFHRKLGIRTRAPGMCLRVLDHPVKQPGTRNMAGILLHEASNISWLTGCIAPRTKGHRELSSDIRPCVEALDTVYTGMGGFGVGRRAALIIVD